LLFFLERLPNSFNAKSLVLLAEQVRPVAMAGEPHRESVDLEVAAFSSLCRCFRRNRPECKDAVGALAEETEKYLAGVGVSTN
jgi:hypothetical protein